MTFEDRLQSQVPLAPHTTLGVGGAAEYFFAAEHIEDLQEALQWAQGRLPVMFLGGGSNLLVADAGVPGLCLQLRSHGVDWGDDGTLWADAGLSWDALVEQSVERNWAGLECLSGIPGWVGAAPVQNIGAYGQELSETLVAVDVVATATGEAQRMTAAELQLGYRHSVLKRSDRYIVTRVGLKLEPEGQPSLRYPELRKEVSSRPSLTEVRTTVRKIRDRKSMLAGGTDENRRSAGSFFTNPIVSSDVADAIDGPKYPADGGTKLSAAWLIEQAGFHKGWGEGPAGLSTRHTLAIVNRGGARATDILDVARTVRDGVQARFGVRLVPEPVFVGMEFDSWR